MSEYALHGVFINPEQAKAAVVGQIAPYCRAQWEKGVARLAFTVMPEDDAKSIQQRKFYHGVVLKEISQQAVVNGQKFALPVWKEHFRETFLGYRWEVVREPFTGKKKRRKVRNSSEDLGVKAYSKLIEQVIAFAVTELGVMFSERDWQNYREK